MKFVLAVALATLTIPAAASASAGAAYVSENALMQAFQENGIMLSGTHRTVLEATCSGTGRPRGVYPYQRFHIFECYVRASGQHATVPPRYRVTTTLRKPGHIAYSYKRIPGL